VKAHARVRYPDGEEATLDLEDGRFRIAAADALPAGARTPAQALEQLRRVLARRSYAGLLRVLSPATRSAIENDIRSLVEGLEQPEGLEVQVAGDTATVQIPGGHEVKLRREAGVWRGGDFDWGRFERWGRSPWRWRRGAFSSSGRRGPGLGSARGGASPPPSS